MTILYTYDFDVFYREDATSYYLLGAFMTDGCIKEGATNKRVSLASKDKDWLEIIRMIICPDKLNYRKGVGENGEHNGVLSLELCSTKLANWFISKGCTPAKSLTLQWPEVPDQYIPDFIRGCLDGDGCIRRFVSIRRTKNNYKETVLTACLCGSSLDFLLGFCNALAKLDIKHKLRLMHKAGSTSKIGNRVITRTADHYQVCLTGKSAQKLVHLVYYPGHKLSMPRKKTIADNMIAYQFKR